MNHPLPRRRFRMGAVGASAVALVLLTACQPTPPPPPMGPDLARSRVFAGLGAWWDIWDWSPTFNTSRYPGSKPPLELADVDRLAESGIQTLYIQPSTFRHPDVVLDPVLLRKIIDRAQAAGMRVVGWYLPEFRNVAFDLERLVAIVKLGVDGVGVDIESSANRNIVDRNEKLLVESRFLRGAYPNLPMAAVPVTPVIWEVINRGWWPNFPYVEMSKYYDAWMPMSYSSNRTVASGQNDPYRHTYDSVVRLRTLTRRPDLPVHPIGGQAKHLSPSDVAQINRAMIDTGSIGGSLYDDNSTPPTLWDSLLLMRRQIVK